MSQRYDVDDILEEIRRKRESEQRGGASGGGVVDEQPVRRRPPSGAKPQARSSPSVFDYDDELPRRASRPPQEPVHRVRADETARERPVQPRHEHGTSSQNERYAASQTSASSAKKGRFQVHIEEDPLSSGQSASGGLNPREAARRRRLRDDPIDIPLDNAPPDSEIPYGDTQEIPSPPRAGRRAPKMGEGPGGGLENSRWQQPYAQQELLEQPVAEDEFASMQDAPYVEKDLKAVRTGLMVRAFGMVILTVISLYLTLALRTLPGWLSWLPEDMNPLPLPEFMWPESSMMGYMIVQLVLCVAASMFCSSIIGGGLASFFRFRADADSPAALAMLAVLLQGGVLMFLPDSLLDTDGSIGLYFPAVFATMFFILIGKLMLIGRIRRNFTFLCSDKPKQAFIQIQNRDFAREFSRGLGSGVNRVAYSAPVDFVSGFLDHSYSADYSTVLSRLMTPICFFGGLLVAVITYLLNRSLPLSVTAFAAVSCICAPFSSAIIPNIMLSSVSRRLTKKDCMLAGYEDAENCCETGALVLCDRDLFSKSNVVLHGMKVFAEQRIDEAILDAASVIISCDGIMSDVFLNMIGGNRKLLKKVDSLIYEDGMGVSAWVNGKRVLIGSRDLMRNHEIKSPTQDFENRYARDGRRVLYIANSGELSAMFVVSYNATRETADALNMYQRLGVGFSVYSTDPNITSNLISSSYGLKRGGVRVLPAKLHPEYIMLTRPKERVNVGTAHTNALTGPLEILKAARRVKTSVHLGAIAQMIGIGVGYGLVAFMSFTNSLKLAGFATVLAFQAVCLLISVGVSIFGKSRRI